jgi:hypothetical protein
VFKWFKKPRSKNVVVAPISVNGSKVGEFEIDYRGHMRAEIFVFLGRNEMTQVIGILHRMNQDLGFRQYNNPGGSN